LSETIEPHKANFFVEDRISQMAAWEQYSDVLIGSNLYSCFRVRCLSLFCR